MNTLSTPLGIFPVAGGVLVRLNSYPVPITACLIARGIASAWRLPEPRPQLMQRSTASTCPGGSSVQARSSSPQD